MPRTATRTTRNRAQTNLKRRFAALEPQGAPTSRPAKQTKTRGQTACNTNTTSAEAPTHVSKIDSVVTPEMLDQERRRMLEDLGDISCVPASYLAKLYPDLITNRTIKKYLTKTSRYDLQAKRWTGLSAIGTSQECLRKAMVDILNDIIDNLGDAEGSREVVDSSDKLFNHMDDRSHYSRPPLSVMATGPSFCLIPSDDSVASVGLSYNNIAAPIDVQTDSMLKDGVQAQMERLAVYNRQVFIHQLNRFHVRSLLLTQSKLRLLHLDHAGAYYTEFVDINEDPYTLVRLVLALSAMDESVLGLDTSVQWKVVDGTRVSGTLTIEDVDAGASVYDLVMDVSNVGRPTVCGRGTACWNAHDPEGNRLLVKDAWRSEEREREVAFLELAKGVPGVVRMLAHEDYRQETDNFRPFASQTVGQKNRVCLRVVLKAYGPSVEHFGSELEAVTAIRDAIGAHRKLLQAGVLHRDISLSNILLNPPGDPMAATLIDLDMAVKFDLKEYPTMTSPVGTRFYQSVYALRNYGRPALAQDYLGDLESFFYILCHLIFGFSGPGQRLIAGERPVFLDDWESQNFRESLGAKLSFLLNRLPETPQSYWSPPTLALFKEFREFITMVVNMKNRIAEFEPGLRIASMLKVQVVRCDEHYDTVLGYFDAAVEALKAQSDAAGKGRDQKVWTRVDG